MSNRFKRILCKAGIGVLYAYAAYMWGGTSYRLLNSSESEEAFIGHYNKERKIAKKEFKEEAKEGLEHLVKKGVNPEKANISANVFIHLDIKRFFDDNQDPSDDALWVEKINKAFEGLDLYRKEGFDFVVYNIAFVDFPYQYYSPEGPNLPLFTPAPLIKPHLNAAIGQVPKVDMNLFFLPPANLELKGFVFKEENYAVTFLNQNDRFNESTLAHETGHLFGLPDKKVQSLPWYKFVVDPFGIIFKEDIMRQGIVPSAFYGLVQEDREYLKFLRDYIQTEQNKEAKPAIR